MKLSTIALLAAGGAAVYWYLSKQGIVPEFSDLMYTGPRDARGAPAKANCSPHSKDACLLLARQALYKGTMWDGKCCRVVKGGAAMKY